jgi:hypothetical protein
MSAEDTCQENCLRAASRHTLLLLVGFQRFCWRLRHDGPLQTARRLLLRIQDRLHSLGQRESREASQTHCEFLNLQAGELVQVKTPEEIWRTLDRTGKVKGLAFMPSMYEYCGRRFRVYKPVRRIIQENVSGSERIRRMSDTVLLEGVICNGNSLSCDRSCFYFWRECWLRRVEAPEQVTRSAAPRSGPSAPP